MCEPTSYIKQGLNDIFRRSLWLVLGIIKDKTVRASSLHRGWRIVQKKSVPWKPALPRCQLIQPVLSFQPLTTYTLRLYLVWLDEGCSWGLSRAAKLAPWLMKCSGHRFWTSLGCLMSESVERMRLKCSTVPNSEIILIFWYTPRTVQTVRETSMCGMYDHLATRSV